MSAGQDRCLLVMVSKVVAIFCLVRLKIDQDDAESTYICIYDCNEAPYNHTKSRLTHMSKA